MIEKYGIAAESLKKINGYCRACEPGVSPGYERFVKGWP
jgi:hypothetical protein